MMPDTASLWAAAKRFEGFLRNDAGALSFAPLADIYRQLGLLEEALETARKGCPLHPDFAAGQMALAKAALESGHNEEALAALEAVVRITPENLEAEQLLAELYSAAGNDSAAQACRAVASSLDPELQESVAAETLSTAAPLEEELFEADILELSDELIDDEMFDDSLGQFAASPERPSLGEGVNRAEPFLITTPPAFYTEEPPDAEASPVMASATIAELYVSQGFPDKGAAVYRELCAADPLNETYEKRLLALTSPEKPLTAANQCRGEEGLLEKLQEWLGNIGRVRACRTSRL